MKTRTFLALLFGATGLAGCTGTAATSAARREPYVKPALVLLADDQARRHGIASESPPVAPVPPPENAPGLDASAVVIPAGVKVYTLDRAIDPSDRDLMHEEHVVYRRETAPQWRLDAPAGQKILVGPRLTDGRQEIQPLLTKELTTFLNDQRRATEAGEKAIAALFKAVDALSRQQQAMLRREKRSTATESSASERANPNHDEPSPPPAPPAVDCK